MHASKVAGACELKIVIWPKFVGHRELARNSKSQQHESHVVYRLEALDGAHHRSGLPTNKKNDTELGPVV